jgi:hypothetical protein
MGSSDCSSVGDFCDVEEYVIKNKYIDKIFFDNIRQTNSNNFFILILKIYLTKLGCIYGAYY